MCTEYVQYKYHRQVSRVLKSIRHSSSVYFIASVGSQRLVSACMSEHQGTVGVTDE